MNDSDHHVKVNERQTDRQTDIVRCLQCITIGLSRGFEASNDSDHCVDSNRQDRQPAKQTDNVTCSAPRKRASWCSAVIWTLTTTWKPMREKNRRTGTLACRQANRQTDRQTNTDRHASPAVHYDGRFVGLGWQ